MRRRWLRSAGRDPRPAAGGFPCSPPARPAAAPRPESDSAAFRIENLPHRGGHPSPHRKRATTIAAHLRRRSRGVPPDARARSSGMRSTHRPDSSSAMEIASAGKPRTDVRLEHRRLAKSRTRNEEHARPGGDHLGHRRDRAADYEVGGGDEVRVRGPRVVRQEAARCVPGSRGHCPGRRSSPSRQPPTTCSPRADARCRRGRRGRAPRPGCTASRSRTSPAVCRNVRATGGTKSPTLGSADPGSSWRRRSARANRSCRRRPRRKSRVGLDAST